MKKVLVYGITNTVGGIETFLINVLKNIDTSKIQIDLLVKEKIDGQNGDGIKDNYNKIFYVPAIKKHPIKTIKYLFKLAKEEKYDIFHINVCDALPIVYAIPFKIFSRKTKIFVHSHSSSGSHKYLQHFFRLIVYKISSKYIACSKEAALWMFGKRVLNNKNYILLPNFIDTKKYLFNEKVRNEMRKNLELDNYFVIGHVGRLNFVKNHKFILKVVSEILKEDKQIILLLVGTGELEQELKEYTKKLAIEKNVLFLGARENVNEYYQAMDLFVLPSLYEGLPIVSIEAQASGLKCLISDNVDKKCNITGNVDFLSIDNIKLWKNKIIQIKNQKNVRVNMELQIKRANYDLGEGIKTIEEFYLEE